MNPALSATFAQAARELLLAFGRAALHRPDGLGAGTAIQAVLTEQSEPVGEYGERMESRHALTVATADGVAVGDTVTMDEVTWTVGQLKSNDGFVSAFAVREADPS